MIDSILDFSRKKPLAATMVDRFMHVPFTRIALWAVGVVAAGWVAYLLFALATYFAAEHHSISELGQLGDAFGLVNALFTGLTLSGLICTILLQMEQNKVQREELSRQAREQFLTARMNLAVAGGQLQIALRRLDSGGTESCEPTKPADDIKVQRMKQAESMKFIKQNVIHLKVLGQEAAMGFDGRPWSPEIEKEAIRRYVNATRKSFVPRFDQYLKERIPGAGAIDLLVESLREEFMMLSEYYTKYPAISELANSVVAMIGQQRSDPERVIEWCRSPEHDYRSGEPPWA
jgi:hypothetical protein